MGNRILARILAPGRRCSAAEAGAIVRGAERLLLVKPHHKLGDLLVSTPVIRNLRRALPRARLVMLAGTYNAPAVLDNPDLDEVLVAELKRPAAPWRGAALVRRLRRERFDAALMLSTISHSTSAVLAARLARPGLLVGFEDAPYGSSLAQQAYDCVLDPPEDLKIHIVDYNLTLLERLGIPVTERSHVLGVTAEQRERAGEILAAARIDPGRPVLGAQVGGTPNRPDRQWPPSHYAAVLQRAAKEYGYQPVLLGQSQDERALAEVSSMGKNPVPTLLDLPFPEYKAVLSRLTFFLTHDGGPVHVAAGVGVPSYFVFLSTPAWRWAPYGVHVAVWEDHERTPSALEVWERVAPRLEAAREPEAP